MVMDSRDCPTCGAILAPIVEPLVGPCQACGQDTMRAFGSGYLCGDIDCQASPNIERWAADKLAEDLMQ